MSKMPMPGFTKGAAPKSAKPMKVRCPACGAPLAFDGKKKLVTAPTLGRDLNVNAETPQGTEQHGQ